MRVLPGSYFAITALNVLCCFQRQRLECDHWDVQTSAAPEGACALCLVSERRNEAGGVRSMLEPCTRMQARTQKNECHEKGINRQPRNTTCRDSNIMLQHCSESGPPNTARPHGPRELLCLQGLLLRFTYFGCKLYRVLFYNRKGDIEHKFLKAKLQGL